MSTANLRTPEMPDASTVTPKTIIAVGAILPALAAIAVALRFYVRVVKNPSLWCDDYLILFALILTLALGIMMIIGSAVHVLAQPSLVGEGSEGFIFVLNDAIVATEKMKWAFDLLEVFVLGGMKLSVTFFYRRLFRGRAFDFYSKSMIAIVGAWVTAFFFTTLLECGNGFEYLWSTLSNLSTHCTDSVTYQNAYATSDIITDVLILIMPIPIIWRLQMSLNQKLAVIAVFLLGFVSVAAGVARIVIQVSQLDDAFSISQRILIISTGMYWSMIQMGLSIIAACLPTLRPLFSDLSPQGWCRNLRSYITLPSKRFFSMRPKQSSDFNTIDSHDLLKESGEISNSSQLRVLPPNTARVTTSIYPMRAMEEQTGTPSWKSTVRDQIERTSLQG